MFQVPHNSLLQQARRTMKTYAQLGHVYRCEPCVEYPGAWLVYINGDSPPGDPTFNSFEEAWSFAKREWEINPLEVTPKISVCWKASDNDPRIGEVWFSPYYQHGWFDQYGKYIT